MAQGRKTGGRKKGTPNKKTPEAVELLEALDANSLEEIVAIARRAAEAGDDQMALNAWKEVAQYQFSKRKAIEHSTKDGEEFVVRLKDAL